VGIERAEVEAVAPEVLGERVVIEAGKERDKEEEGTGREGMGEEEEVERGKKEEEELEDVRNDVEGDTDDAAERGLESFFFRFPLSLLSWTGGRKLGGCSACEPVAVTFGGG
jgi:hypothetical protein